MRESALNTEKLVSGVFGRVPVMWIGCVLITLDMCIGSLLLWRVPSTSIKSMNLIVFGILLLCAFSVGFGRWKYIQKRRKRVIAQLDPGVYRFFGKHRVWFSLEGIEPLTEQEQVSSYDQADTAMRIGNGADLVFFAVMVGMFVVLPIIRNSQGWWIRLSMITLFAAIALRWFFLGDGLHSGFNRLRIDPEGWEWGGWSRRLMQRGRWDSTRVLIKQITMGGRERYFVVLGDENGSVGIIVPRASMVLIERAYIDRRS